MTYSLTIYYSPVCQKQILTFPATSLSDFKEIAVQRSFNYSFSSGFPDSQHSRTSRSIHPTRPEPKIRDIEPELEEDISFFKRIVQEITDLQRKRSIIVETTLQALRVANTADAVSQSRVRHLQAWSKGLLDE